MSVTVAAVAALVMGGCERTGGQQVSPTTTEPTGRSTVPVTPTPTEPVRVDERRPARVSFLMRAENCARFADAVRPLAAEAVGPWGFDGGGYATAGDMREMAPMAGPMPSAGRATDSSAAAAPKAGADFSGTNVQEAGVDEPDTVKTDGKILVTTTDGRLRVMDVTGRPRQVGVLEIPSGAGNLLLVGNRALLMSDSGRYQPEPLVRSSPGFSGSGPVRPTTSITVVDLVDPAKPTIVRTHTIDGAYLDARLVGGTVRVVTRSRPDIAFPQRTMTDESGVEKAQAANADLVRTAGAAAFLPKGASCADAFVPVEGAGMGTIAVQSLDPAAESPGPAVTVVADASTVYASATRLFVTTSRYRRGPVQPASGKASPVSEPLRTAVHAFDITDPAKARYAGSGDVPGRLLNSFSLSEDAGALRVATTLDATGFGDPGRGAAPTASQSRVTILRPAGAEWVETGAVDGLGKGERIYAVRFLGATGYVVTFRQTDPLYVLDLRDVSKPKVTGELKITGYSAYLHPAGERRLLGIGQDATDQGRRVGTQLSLFDVANPAAPAKLAGAVLPAANSSAEAEHHAFLYWPATGLVVAPIQSYGNQSGGIGEPTPGNGGPTRPFVGAVAFRVGDRSVTEAGRITHPGDTPIDRSLVVGDRLLTLSRVGLATNDLKTIADIDFLAFR